MKNKNTIKLNKTISRRFIFLSLLKASVIGAISWRLFDLQLIENQKYEKLSDNNQFDFHAITPERGKILDRKMRLIAGNEDAFHLILNWNQNLNTNDIINKILKVIKLEQKDISNFKNKISVIDSSIPQKIVITKKLSKKDLSKLVIRSVEFPEITIFMSKRRIYPQGNIVGHITGYIGEISNKNNNYDHIKMSGIKVGKRGLEKFFENELTGKFGRKRNEVTAKGFVIASHVYEKTKPGKDIQISLDMELQAFASKRLERGNLKIQYLNTNTNKNNSNSFFSYDDKKYLYKDKNNNNVLPNSGSLMVMDIVNGEILCSVSSPGFDPNIFSNELGTLEWNSLKKNTRAPFLNRSMSGVYPPGSTIKMAVALAALESGLIDFKTKFFVLAQEHLATGNFIAGQMMDMVNLTY